MGRRYDAPMFVQGAVYGAKALAMGAGPLMFAAIFSAFTKTESPFPFFPGVLDLLSALFRMLPS